MPGPHASRPASRRPGSGATGAASQAALPSGWVAPLAGALRTPPALAAPLLVAALDHLACPLLLLQPDATLLYANRAARDWLPASGVGAGVGGLDLSDAGRLRIAGQADATARLHAALKALLRGAAELTAPGSPWAAATGRVLWLALAHDRGPALAAGELADRPLVRPVVRPAVRPPSRSFNALSRLASGDPVVHAGSDPSGAPSCAPDPADRAGAAGGKGFGPRGWALVALHSSEGGAAGLLVGPTAFGAGPVELPRFAALLGLTPAETRVLQALSQGAEPTAIAQQGGVSLATVRSQLAALRAKSGRGRLTALLQEVAALPPVAPHRTLPEPSAEALLRARSLSPAETRLALRPPRPADSQARGTASSGAGAAVLAPWLPAVLDALGIGLMLFDRRSRLSFANAAARRRLQGGQDDEVAVPGRAAAAPSALPSTLPSTSAVASAGSAPPPVAGSAPAAGLHVHAGALHTRRDADAASLREALVAAREGRPDLLRLGSGDQALCLSLLPLPGSAVLGVLGLEPGQAWPGLAAYARHLHLTGAETRVLAALAAGDEPRDIARQLGVAMSTLRTQIGSLRGKSGAPSIRELVRQLATLPLVAAPLSPPAAPSAGAVWQVRAWRRVG